MRTPRRSVSAAAALVALALLAGACGGPDGSQAEVSSDGGWLDDGGWTEAEEGTAALATTDGASAAARKDVAAFGSATAVEKDASSTFAPSEPAPPSQAPVGLTAGSTDDNERWDDYLRYRSDFLRLGIPVHDVDVTERHVLRVRDRDSRPVLGAEVEVFAGPQRVAELRTYADGRALFFPRAAGVEDDESLRVVVGDVEVPLPRDRFEHVLTVPVRQPAVTKVDIVFLLDATGSMDDEIDRLKSHMRSVADRIAGRDDDVDVRFGLTAYRDGGDSFVTRTFDLTDDVAAFHDALNEVQAGGGGDTPEALSAGLRAALAKPSWRGADTVKLVFLVADAPPQMEDPEGADYAVEVRKAATAGVKIHPIASSGLDDQGEFVYRQLAQITTGRFVFLTYGADGGPGDATTHHVDKYAVLSLDALVVQLVEDELASTPSGQQQG